MSIAITGMSTVNPLGANASDYWDSVQASRSGLVAIDQYAGPEYKCHVAGVVDPFDATSVPKRLRPQTDRCTKMALVCADDALSDAKLDPATFGQFEVGASIAATSGGFEYGEQQLHNQWAKGPQFVSGYQSFAWFYAVNTGQVSIKSGLTGPSSVTVADEVGGAEALVVARRRIRQGAKAMVVGGADASLSPWGWVALTSDGMFSRATDPAQAYLPFSENATGPVPGEGASLLVIEDADNAAARGATIRGYLTGVSTTFGPKSQDLVRAIAQALEEANLTPPEIGLVLADGYGSVEMDRVEWEALEWLFGVHRTPIAVPKTGIGRLGSATVPTDMIVALKALETRVLPPLAARQLASTVREVPLEHVLVVARGRRGHNSALVVSKNTN